MTGDIGVVITSFVGVVMILRELGSIISSESFLQKSDGFNALRVCGLVSAARCMHSLAPQQLPTPPGGHYDSYGSIGIMHVAAILWESLAAIARV